MTFKDLFTSQAFIFASERDLPGYQGARGPWVKVGKSSYRELRDGYAHGATHTVGTAKVAVYPFKGGMDDNASMEA
jgi:hypothetical protein